MNQTFLQKDPLIKTLNIINKWQYCREFIQLVSNEKPKFILAVGSTKTALLPGLSAAGKNTEALKQTPKLDADFIAKTIESNKGSIPISPHGIPSPAIITKAIINLLDLEYELVDTGAFVKPSSEHLSLNMGPADCLTTGNALGGIKLKFLFNQGEKLALKYKGTPYVVLGESIPGGTTTALSTLCALGINAFNLVSSSLPEGNHFIKNHTVKESLLENAGKFEQIKKNPLRAVEFFGDPVQAFICGFISKAQEINLPIVLAGGSQMIAIYFIARRYLEKDLKNIVVGTTSWVAEDSNSSTKELASLTDCPTIASTLNFNESTHDGLRKYEEGHIKEGVGAGGLLVASSLYKSLDQVTLLKEIEGVYRAISC